MKLKKILGMVTIAGASLATTMFINNKVNAVVSTNETTTSISEEATTDATSLDHKLDQINGRLVEVTTLLDKKQPVTANRRLHDLKLALNRAVAWEDQQDLESNQNYQDITTSIATLENTIAAQKTTSKTTPVNQSQKSSPKAESTTSTTKATSKTQAKEVKTKKDDQKSSPKAEPMKSTMEATSKAPVHQAKKGDQSWLTRSITRSTTRGQNVDFSQSMKTPVRRQNPSQSTIGTGKARPSNPNSGNLSQSMSKPVRRQNLGQSTRGSVKARPSNPNSENRGLNETMFLRAESKKQETSKPATPTSTAKKQVANDPQTEQALMDFDQIIAQVEKMDLLKDKNAIKVAFNLLANADSLLKIYQKRGGHLGKFLNAKEKLDQQITRVKNATTTSGPIQFDPELASLSVDQQVTAIIKKMQENPDRGHLSADDQVLAMDVQQQALNYEKEMENSPEGFELQHQVFDEQKVVNLFNSFAKFNRGTAKIYSHKLKKGQTKYITIGDLHGNLWAAKLAVEQAEVQHAHIVVLGDFLERGKNSIEVAMYLFSYQMLHPDRMTIVAGDHDLNDSHGGVLGDYGFDQELNDKKYTNQILINDAINQATATLPFGIFAENHDGSRRSYLGHGGITENLNLIHNIQEKEISAIHSVDKVERIEEDENYEYNHAFADDFKPTDNDKLNQQIANKYASDFIGMRKSVDGDRGDLFNLLWGDPTNDTQTNETNGYIDSGRDGGIGWLKLFGPTAFARFCEEFQVQDFIRAHQHNENSPGARVSLAINGHRVITTLGAPNIGGGSANPADGGNGYYKGRLCNNSAILCLDGETLEPSIATEYEACTQTGEPANSRRANAYGKRKLNYNHIRELPADSKNRRSDLETVYD